MFWEELNVNSFKEAVATTKGVCIFTMGCLEKHGNHLPLGTDIITAREIAKRATAIEDAMIFPSYPLGIVAEVKHKAGTIAISSSCSSPYWKRSLTRSAAMDLKRSSSSADTAATIISSTTLHRSWWKRRKITPFTTAGRSS